VTYHEVIAKLEEMRDEVNKLALAVSDWSNETTADDRAMGAIDNTIADAIEIINGI
jgi:hypothetical protein